MWNILKFAVTLFWCGIFFFCVKDMPAIESGSVLFIIAPLLVLILWIPAIALDIYKSKINGEEKWKNFI